MRSIPFCVMFKDGQPVDGFVGALPEGEIRTFLDKHVPTTEELAALDPDLRTALYGQADLPFSFTLVFPRFDGPDFERAVALAKASAEYREVGQGEQFRIRARFYPADVERMRELFVIAGRHPGCEVLVDDRPVPFARELWLPLTWYLLGGSVAWLMLGNFMMFKMATFKF